MLLTISLSTRAAQPYDCFVGGLGYKISGDVAYVTYYSKETTGYNKGGKYYGNYEVPSSITWNSKTYKVTGIGDHAFENCLDMGTVTLPEGILWIGEYAFYNCSLKGINIPLSVKRIAKYAFWSSGIDDIELPDNITTIEYFAFVANQPGLISDHSTKIRVNRGTSTQLSLWQINISPYDKKSNQLLERPFLSYISTQTTIVVRINNMSEDFLFYNTTGPVLLKENRISFENLFPNEKVNVVVIAVKKDEANNPEFWYEMQIETKSKDLEMRFNEITSNATSIMAQASYKEGNANVIRERIKIGNDVAEKNSITKSGLDPKTKYTLYYCVDVKGGKDNVIRTFNISKDTNTSDLSLTTLQPKVISPGNVIVAAESNLDDEETNVGFEWRRTDWSDDFASNTGGAYLYEGTMEGYIRNLNTEKLWKFRPYYTSNSGKTYYGDWVGLDPTNTSYFEPTVHTYAKVSVQGNSAEVKGYAMRGSDNVTSQGFMYWKTSNGARAEAGSNVTVPKDAMTVEAKGNMMTATLEGLDYESTYSYVAFMTTSEGETFYGELQSFQTGEDTSGVETLVNKANDSKTAIYDIRGRRLDAPQRGINIIRMSNGVTKKVFVK